MSQTEVAITCPNCGFSATHAYCARCGQSTHLHKETFWGLVSHFFGHYFHYDSKFWQSMKALWFSPGKLTVAYTNRQRMRFVPPISLYIFISAVYFLTAYSTGNGFLIKHRNEDDEKLAQKDMEQAKTKDVGTGKVEVFRSNDFGVTAGDENSRFGRFIGKKAEKIKAEYGSTQKFFREKIDHDMPKIFFFMIPVMAGILKLLYVGRRELYFVDHAIFSIHYHAFWFSLFTLRLFGYLNSLPWLLGLMLTVAFIYMAAALHRVYHSGWVRSVVYTITIGASYSFLWLMVFALYTLGVMVFA